ncbi:hypothetical protein BDR06DRAFT_63945 [Suillus hirtellus]|nr:hypothetical protein BDR06DRAFT_63945 [Suillus hirtellus]
MEGYVEAMVKKGEVKAIVTSNFSQMMLEKIFLTAEIIPAVNQACFTQRRPFQTDH